MIDALFRRLREIVAPADPEPSAAPEWALACLMVEAARADGRIDGRERATATTLLTRLGLSEERAARLLARAEEQVARSVQLLPWTRAIKDEMAPDERALVIEQLFEVAYADGRLDAMEDQLIRRIAGLIYVSDHARGTAHRRVRRRLGLDED